MLVHQNKRQEGFGKENVDRVCCSEGRIQAMKEIKSEKLDATPFPIDIFLRACANLRTFSGYVVNEAVRNAYGLGILVLVRST